MRWMWKIGKGLLILLNSIRIMGIFLCVWLACGYYGWKIVEVLLGYEQEAEIIIGAFIHILLCMIAAFFLFSLMDFFADAIGRMEEILR